MEITRLFDIPYYQLEKYPKETMFAKKENGKWISYSTQQFIELVNQVSLGLLSLGIKKNDKVGIISANRPEWNMVDLGALQIGAIDVPIYPTITPDDYKYILNNAEVKIIFVSNDELYQKVASIVDGLEIKPLIFSFDSIQGVKNWSEVLEAGKNGDGALLEQLKSEVNPSDLATLIYTSGTTGNPKGVMLSHNNVIANVKSAFPCVPVDETANALSFLPLCHIYERMITYLYMRVGVSVYYAESMETIADNLKEIQPHLFTTVPRLLEKVYDKIYLKGLDLTGIKKFLFFWALELGLKYDNTINMGWLYNFQLKLANKIIFSKWREALGGNVKLIVSGSAALQPRLARVFNAAHIRVMEGYGLTETSPVLSVNRYELENYRVGTVGLVVNDVAIKIAEDGEILAKGPNIMMGYYKNEEATKEVIDEDGWLHTGDIGQFIDGKFLKITDRKKEIFKTSGGKYISPQQIENSLKESIVIEQVMVIGEYQKFPAAFIVPSFDNLKEWCKNKEIAYSSDAEMIKNERVIKKMTREVEKVNDKLAQYEKIKQFELLPALFSIEAGELTPTLKPKRKKILEKYKHLVEKIYGPQE